MNTAEDYYRDRAIEALRTYGQTNAAMGASRTYLVHDAWQRGERNVSRLAELAGVSRDTIYADLRRYDVEVAEDLQARLARWTEDTAHAEWSGDSDCYGFAGYGYRRVWVRDDGKAEIELFFAVADGRTAGTWGYTQLDDTGEVTAHDFAPMTHECANVLKQVADARERTGSTEKAINEVVRERAGRARLEDLHASCRPHWI